MRKLVFIVMWCHVDFYHRINETKEYSDDFRERHNDNYIIWHSKLSYYHFVNNKLSVDCKHFW